MRAGHLPALGSAAKSNRCDQRTETHHRKGAPAAEADPSGSNAARAGTFPAFDDIPALPFIAGGLIGSVHTLLPAAAGSRTTQPAAPPSPPRLRIRPGQHAQRRSEPVTNSEIIPPNNESNTPNALY